MVRVERILVSLCLASLLFGSNHAQASVVGGEEGETFVDPIFSEEATAQTEFSLRVNLDRFATLYNVVRLRTGGAGYYHDYRVYQDADNVYRYDWKENEVKRPVQVIMEVAAEYAFTSKFSLEIQVPFAFSADRTFVGEGSEHPRIVTRYHNVAQDPVTGTEFNEAEPLEQDEYTSGVQTDPIWLGAKYTIYAARGETYSNALSLGLKLGYLGWGERLPRHYYPVSVQNVGPEGAQTEVRWFNHKDSPLLAVLPYIAFQRSYGTWQVGGQMGVQTDILLSDREQTAVSILLGLNASYLLNEYLAGVIEFVGDMDLFTMPALWGFAPGMRLMYPLGDDSADSRLHAGLALLLPVYDEDQTDPYNATVRLTAGIEF